MIEYDSTQRSTVAVCACGAREILWSAEAAYDWAAGHLRVCSLLDAERQVDDRVRALAAVRAGRARYR